MPCVSVQQAAMSVYGSIEDHIFDGISNFLTGFFTSLEMFFYTI